MGRMGGDRISPRGVSTNVLTRPRRHAIAALSLLGMGDALYMLAYEEGLIDSLICPFFGQGCNVVGRSKHARHFGIPNAAAGAVAYGLLGTLALWPTNRAPNRAARTLAIQTLAGAAVAASAVLVWEQAAKVRAWCFWCLTSAAINPAILCVGMGSQRMTWDATRAAAAVDDPCRNKGIGSVSRSRAPMIVDEEE